VATTITSSGDTAKVAGSALIAGPVQTDKFTSFSVLQKKYLKTVIITNVMYAAGFGLYRGVVIPRYRKVDGIMETMKLMPLSILSGAMMYVSLPMSTVTSYRARSNYDHYFIEKPRNFTVPLLAIGIGSFIGMAGVNYWQMYSDFRDNNEFDNSYKKYDKPMYALLDAGTITWIGANLYSLGYVVFLGNKAANKKPPAVACSVAPFRIHEANGMAFLCEF
jgi:hypothetical protein